jgi:antirestriction protein ArdC
MNADQLKNFTTDAIDRLGALLDAGKSDQLIALLRAMARFHKYSWHNTFLIAAQRPTATRVAGFHTWRAVGRCVRKGEKGIAIVAPVVRRRADDEDRDDARPPLTFRVAHVFDVDQTDGQPLPEIARASGEPGHALSAIRTAIAAHGIALDYADSLDGALGVSRGGRIDVLRGLQPADEFTVLAHEWAHELLHRDADRPKARDTRELEAEAVAFVVGEAAGLDVAEASRDYVMLYGGDRDALIASLGRIQRAASTILAALDRELGTEANANGVAATRGA